MSDLILLVEDEADLASTLEYNLEKEGFRVRHASTGEAALAAWDVEPPPSLVLLDLMLPDISGLEICRRIRSKENGAHIPVLMLTARGEEFDRVVGFEAGADDYVIKPFSVRELLLRIRAVLRRSRPGAAVEPATGARFGRLMVDTEGHRVWIDDEEIALTALEFRLLRTFMERRGRVQSRETLLDDVWGADAHVGDRTVDTHVKRLREKLGEAGCYIETLRGVGYRFRARPEGEAA